jgi:hypothetical protein
VFVSRRTTMLDQHVKDAGQMRTPPPLTPRDIETRVLRICNEYDKIQEASKKNVSGIFFQKKHNISSYKNSI